MNLRKLTNNTFLKKRNCFRDGSISKRSSWCLKVFNPEISSETANLIKISLPPEPLPEHLKNLSECGCDWQRIVFAEATTGVVRFHELREHPTGHFATNVWFLQSNDAQHILELSNNCAAYKSKMKIAKGTTAMVGCMTSSDVIQYFFPNLDGVEFYDSIATNG